MDPIQSQGTEPEPAAPPEAPELPLSSEPAAPLEPAAQEWLGKMGVKPQEAPEAAQKPREAGQPAPHPQDRLHHDFRNRINRRQREQQMLEENRRQAELIQQMHQLIAPLMDTGEEEPQTPEMLDPAQADPTEWWNRNLEILDARLNQRLAPVLTFFEEAKRRTDMQAEQVHRVEEARSAVAERMEMLAPLEAEYAETEQGQGYYDRVGTYLQFREQMLLNLGYPPQVVKGHVLQMLDGITMSALRHPAGPQHPAWYLDRVIQSEMPWLFQKGGGGSRAAAPPAPAAPVQSRTARELQQAASSGVTGSVAQHGKVQPANGDLESLIASGKANPAKLREVLKARNGGKMPTDMSAAMARINQEVAELAQKRTSRR